ncbi:MAG: tryptophan-rich hypothetical protein [Oceanicoccus sp.]
MNHVNPKSLLNSKWTKVDIRDKEKHFVITKVDVDEDKTVIDCTIQAVINNREYSLNWRELKNTTHWRQGWQ